MDDVFEMNIFLIECDVDVGQRVTYNNPMRITNGNGDKWLLKIVFFLF